MNVPELWIGDKVYVKMFGEGKPLVGELVEVNSRGVVINVDTGDEKQDYPEDESIDVLAFVPMMKVNAILLTR